MKPRKQRKQIAKKHSETQRWLGKTKEEQVETTVLKGLLLLPVRKIRACGRYAFVGNRESSKGIIFCSKPCLEEGRSLRVIPIVVDWCINYFIFHY